MRASVPRFVMIDIGVSGVEERKGLYESLVVTWIIFLHEETGVIQCQETGWATAFIQASTHHRVPYSLIDLNIWDQAPS